MKIFLGTIVGIFLVLAVLTTIAPKEFKLEREILINKPKAEVFGHLKFLKNHEQWNAWSKKDPSMKKEFKGTDGMVGFISAWESNHEEVGTAEQEIKEIVEGQKLDTEIRFKKPFEGRFNSYVTTESINEDQTKVVIGMSDTMQFPMTVISFIVNVCLGNQKTIAKNMDDSLNNLKLLLEK